MGMLYHDRSCLNFEGLSDCLGALNELPDPTSMGPRHRPISPAHSVTSLLSCLDDRDITPTRMQMALTKATKSQPYGAMMYLVLDLEGFKGVHDLDMTRSLLYINSPRQLSSAKLFEGLDVAVCANGITSYDHELMRRKATTFRNLHDHHEEAINRFCSMNSGLVADLEAMARRELSDSEAKQVIFDAAYGVRIEDSVISPRSGLSPEDQKSVTYCFPPSKLAEVSNNYFHAPYAKKGTMDDCVPRDLTGVLAGITRALRGQSPETKLDQTTHTMRYLAALAA